MYLNYTTFLNNRRIQAHGLALSHTTLIILLIHQLSIILYNSIPKKISLSHPSKSSTFSVGIFLTTWTNFLFWDMYIYIKRICKKFIIYNFNYWRSNKFIGRWLISNFFGTFSSCINKGCLTRRCLISLVNRLVFYNMINQFQISLEDVSTYLVLM